MQSDPRYGDPRTGDPRYSDPHFSALPPEDRPETGPRKELPPQFRRTQVDYFTKEPAGTIVYRLSGRQHWWDRYGWVEEGRISGSSLKPPTGSDFIEDTLKLGARRLISDAQFNRGGTKRFSCDEMKC